MWAFGWGKRKCVGEHLAKIELAAFIAAIVKRYKIRYTWLEGNDKYGTQTGLLRRPKAAKYTFERV